LGIVVIEHEYYWILNFALYFKIQNGATFIKIDKFDVKKDNSPALCFLGMLSNSKHAFYLLCNFFFCLMLVILNKVLIPHLFPMQMMVVEWTLAQFENAWAWVIHQRSQRQQLDNVSEIILFIFLTFSALDLKNSTHVNICINIYIPFKRCSICFLFNFFFDTCTMLYF